MSTESHDIALRFEELAASLAARGQLNDAAALYERVVAIKREMLGSGHPEVVRSLHDLALLQESSGMGEQAGELWAEARRILDSWEEQGA